MTKKRLKILEIPLKTDFQYFQREDGAIFRFDGTKLVEIKGWLEKSRFDNTKIYRRFAFMMNGKKKQFYGQRITCFTFHGDPGILQIARHKTANTLNNAADAVEWGDYSQNNYEDKIRDGTLPNGRKIREKIGEVVTATKPEDKPKDYDPDNLPF